MSDWASLDYSLLGSALGATYADGQSTKEMLKRGGEETNPILGKHPSGQAVDQYMALSGAGIGAAATLIDSPKYRRAMLAGITGLEAGYAIQNQKVEASSEKKTMSSAMLGMPLLMAGAFAVLAHSLSSDIQPYLKSDSSKPEFGISYERKF